ncbi:type II toxin-antitoxin system RelE/ParE family toxin [Iningainema tapete]|uniref:type II toxin-antitoxin system RelE/ParE family toxin n=1 Tax=Iningainema tapete TaxID=2806730 RepID=UPI003B58AE92
MWEILFHDEFEAWFDQQDPALQEEIAAVLDVLSEEGPTLGRPYVDTISESSFNNMKELRVQFRGFPWRILFAFDPERKAILLVGGNKQGNKRWYEENIPIADKRFKEHLEELQRRNQQ